jgi:hypothetical protein
LDEREGGFDAGWVDVDWMVMVRRDKSITDTAKGLSIRKQGCALFAVVYI